MILRFGMLKLFRWKNGKPTLNFTLPGYITKPPELKYDWTPFFVGHYGQEKTVFSYRKS